MMWLVGDPTQLEGRLDLLNGKCDPVATIPPCPVPVIAAVGGWAVTGMLELDLPCDIIVAYETALVLDGHARMGVLPSWGMPQHNSRRIGNSRALQMSMTGAVANAAIALPWGLVDCVHRPCDLVKAAMKIAHSIAQWDSEFTAAHRSVMRSGGEMPLSQSVDAERWVAQFPNSRLEPKTTAGRYSADQ
ncbi:MAG: enoyl-CoA hydratase-related protein [Novosphingobium sp.]